MSFIHPSASIHKLADIEASEKGSHLFIGEQSVIDAFVKVKFAGGIGDIKIGKRCYLNSGCVLYSGNGIAIDDNVLIAANCTLAPANHEFSRSDTAIIDQGFSASKGGIRIASDCWIGANCVLLDGAVVSRGSVFAAGTIIKGQSEPFTVYAGPKMRVIGKRHDG